MRTALYALAVVAPVLALDGGSTRVEWKTIPQPVIQRRLEAVKPKLHERRETLEELFREAGCGEDRLTIQRVPGSTEPNVICTLPSEGERVIVVGGHFDFIDHGLGAVDDWSGAALLPSLYQSLREQPRRHRFVFVGFAGEERGLLGSSEFVKKLGKPGRAAVSGMVNLECLGLSAPTIWLSRADKRLADAYLRVAVSIGVKPSATNVDRVGDDDSHPFLNAKLPVITIHSLTQQTFPVLHGPRDRVEAVDPEQYYTAYKLASLYLAYLDGFLN